MFPPLKFAPGEPGALVAGELFGLCEAGTVGFTVGHSLHTGHPERLLFDDPHGHGGQVTSTGGSVGQAKQTGQPERLFPLDDPHGHGAQVASTGGSVEHSMQTGHPDLLLFG